MAASEIPRSHSDSTEFRLPAATTSSRPVGRLYPHYDKEWPSPEAEAEAASAAELPRTGTQPVPPAGRRHDRAHSAQAGGCVQVDGGDGPVAGDLYPHYDREWPSQQAEAAAAAAVELPRSLASRNEARPFGGGAGGSSGGWVGGNRVGGLEVYPQYETDWPSPEAEVAAAAAAELPRSLSSGRSELGNPGAGGGGDGGGGWLEACGLYPEFGMEWPSPEAEAAAAAAAERQSGLDDADLLRGAPGTPSVAAAAAADGGSLAAAAPY
jgi:hypothetical protein